MVTVCGTISAWARTDQVDEPLAPRQRRGARHVAYRASVGAVDQAPDQVALHRAGDGERLRGLPPDHAARSAGPLRDGRAALCDAGAARRLHAAAGPAPLAPVADDG